MSKPTTAPTIAESDLRSHEINRLQRAMHHMLVAHQGASLVSNNLRAANEALQAKVAAQTTKIAALEQHAETLEKQMEATWATAITTAANVAEFACQSTYVANAIRKHDAEGAPQIAEMIQAAKGE